MKRAVLYARVSTPRQAELYSLDYQLAQEREYAEAMGFAVVAELRDDQTGRTMSRDGLEEARQLLAENKADILITWKLDRLHRSYINTVLLRDEIQKMGKELHYAQLRQKSGTTAKQRLPEDIMALMAEIEADEIAERTTMGKRQKALAGKWIGLNKPPYGYKAMGQGRDIRLNIDEAQARIVRLVFQWYVEGDEQGAPLGVKDIARKLTNLGIPTPMDHINPARKVRGYGVWSTTPLYRMLRETAYVGIFYQYKKKKVGGTKVVTTDKTEWVGVPTPVIVDPQLFEQARTKLDQGIELSRRGTKYEYLLARRVTCECGYKMFGFVTKSNYRAADGTTRRYVYTRYGCPGKGGGKKYVIRPCTMPYIKVEKLDGMVWEYIKTQLADPELLRLKLEEIQQAERKQHQSKEERLEALVTHKARIEGEMRRLATLYARNDLPAHIIDDLLTQEGTKLHSVQAEMEKVAREEEGMLTDAAVADLVGFAHELQERIAGIEEDFQSKRAIIDLLDVRVTVCRNEQGKQYLKVSSVLEWRNSADYVSLFL